MTEGVPPGTNRLLALRISENATAEDLVHWAIAALESSWDSPALRMLAGIDLRPQPSIWDAEPYFVRAMSELGIETPDREIILRRFVDEIALDIATGSIAPQAGADMIHRTAVSPLNHPADLQEWCYLWEGIDPALGPIDKSQIDDVIRAYARRWRPSGGEA